MANNRAFAYNPFNLNVPGCTQYGDLSVGHPSEGFNTGNSTNLRWWGGPDEDLGYVIAYSQPDGLHPTPIDLTFSTTYKDIHTVVSNNNQTISGLGTALTTTRIPSPDFVMFSILVNNEPGTGFGRIGLGTLEMNLEGQLGDDANSIGFSYDGWVYFNGAPVVNTTLAWGPGSIVDIAWKGNENLLFVRVNGSDWNGTPTANPSNGLGGYYFSGVSFYPAVSSSLDVSGNYFTIQNVSTYQIPPAYNFWGHLTASVGFWGTEIFANSFDDSTFIALANQVANGATGSFSTPVDAVTWLNANGYWTSYIPPILNLDASVSESFPGAGGPFWYDISGFNHNGEITGATWSNTAGGTFNFSGSGQYVFINQPIQTGSSYTITAWVNASSVAQSRNIVSSNLSPFWIANGLLAAGVDGDYTIVSNPFFPPNQWKHVTFVFDSAHIATLYINGVQADQAPTSQTYTQQPTYIGCHFTNTQVSFWEGQIASVKIWDQPLSSGRVLSDFHETKTRFGL